MSRASPRPHETWQEHPGRPGQTLGQPAQCHRGHRSVPAAPARRCRQGAGEAHRRPPACRCHRGRRSLPGGPARPSARRQAREGGPSSWAAREHGPASRAARDSGPPSSAARGALPRPSARRQVREGGPASWAGRGASPSWAAVPGASSWAAARGALAGPMPRHGRRPTRSGLPHRPLPIFGSSWSRLPMLLARGEAPAERAGVGYFADLCFVTLIGGVSATGTPSRSWFTACQVMVLGSTRT
jgi:hypothetical protein